MATTVVECDDTAYVLASSVDCILQNISTSTVRVAFSATLPAVDTVNYHVLERFDDITKSSGFPADNIYVRSNDAGRTSFVAVSP